MHAYSKLVERRSFIVTVRYSALAINTVLIFVLKFWCFYANRCKTDTMNQTQNEKRLQNPQVSLHNQPNGRSSGS